MSSCILSRTYAAAAVALCVVGFEPQLASAETVFSASGAAASSIQATVDAFRTDLGALNLNVVGSFGTGRREINWDGVPDALAAPNNLPANFFNVNSPRSIILDTPGTGFQVSANAVNPTSTPILFGNINPVYPTQFQAFSPQRIFTALGSNITGVNFFIPGSSQPALTNAFGAVFTDVETANSTSLSFFDAQQHLLGTFFVPVGPNQGLSFLGVDFGSAIIARVLITSGNAALGPNEIGGLDLVAMDDFIYGEPVSAVPLPGALPLFATGLGALGLLGWRRKQKTQAALI